MVWKRKHSSEKSLKVRIRFPFWLCYFLRQRTCFAPDLISGEKDPRPNTRLLRDRHALLPQRRAWSNLFHKSLRYRWLLTYSQIRSNCSRSNLATILQTTVRGPKCICTLPSSGDRDPICSRLIACLFALASRLEHLSFIADINHHPPRRRNAYAK